MCRLNIAGRTKRLRLDAVACCEDVNPYTDRIFLEPKKRAPLGDDHVAGCRKRGLKERITPWLGSWQKQGALSTAIGMLASFSSGLSALCSSTLLRLTMIHCAFATRPEQGLTC
ncbi:uncharacterized protein TrAFT101_002128 [Trichoderma asperellum]|uniref:uncharacterized protein n=1 Tax=Trichoderma asperellum TaxID=101201 RepID=UPI00332DF41B|nr:hypothetical protein TrAFT101_002128 [Trichoderma asperellum]